MKRIFAILFPLVFFALLFILPSFTTFWFLSLSAFIIIIRFWLSYGWAVFVKNDKDISVGKQVVKFIKKSLMVLGAGLAIITGFIWYQIANPPVFSIHSLHSEKLQKDIVFIEMSHIATKDFYDEVKKTISDYTSHGYTLYYEAVDTDVEGMAISNNLGFELEGGTYDTLKDILHLSNIEAQDNTALIGSSKGRVEHADVKFSDLLTEEGRRQFQKKADSDRDVKNEKTIHPTEFITTTQVAEEKPLRINLQGKGSIQEKLDSIPSVSKKLYGYLTQAYMNFLLKNEGVYRFNQKVIYHLLSLYKQEKDGGEKYARFFQDKVLDYRNKHLAQSIIDGGDDKIIITYGKMHYDGFVEELKKYDPNITESIIKKVPVF